MRDLMTRRFQTLDVFTETALAGNPLAVVLDAEGLDDVAHAGDRRRVQPVRNRVRLRAEERRSIARA